MKQTLSLTFVIPCLNEEATLGTVLDKINKVRQECLNDRNTQVIVSDNGSEDRSIEIARDKGARVVHCQERGYGAALQCGINNAETELVVFADADNTYDFLETPRLVEEIDKGFDMVVGSRLHGTIHNGAMPVLHRFVGTPILNFFINALYAGRDNKIKDCNSGFRCFKRSAFQKWGVYSTGMEFASEMLVKALKSQASISHVPISLYPDERERVPHLRTWRDGMRHLLQIFLDCPAFFYRFGLLVFLAGWLVILAGITVGPISLGQVEFLDIHSMLFGLLGTVAGIVIWSAGLFVTPRIESSVRLYKKLIDMSEGVLFWVCFWLFVGSIIFILPIFIYWGVKGFHTISIAKPTVGLIALSTNCLLIIWNLVTAHLIKRT